MEKSLSGQSFKSQAWNKQAKQTIALIERYFQGLEDRPVKAAIKPGDLAAAFSQQPPSEGIDFSSILKDVEDKILPGLTHWQHPGFLAYYPATSSIPAILSETIIAATAAVGLQWSSSPIATELECLVMDWLLDLQGAEAESPFRHRSKRGGGFIQNTAGEAMAIVMTAARVHYHWQEQAETSSSLQAEDLESLYYRDSSSLVVYMSDDTHFSGPKAARVAGLRVHKINSRRLPNGNFGIDASQLEEAIAVDRRRGLKPCALLLNYGTTNTCGYDDVQSFANIAKRERLWVHVDAAYAGAALVLPERHQDAADIRSIADSFNFNGSKWFLCGFDSAFLYVKDRSRLKRVFSADADYLAAASEEEVYNPEFKDWSIPLGRRFRSLRIWMVLSYFGSNGIRDFLRSSIQLADELRLLIERSENFESLVTTDLGLVCFSVKNADSEYFAQYFQRLQDELGSSFLVYSSVFKGRPFIRVAIGGVLTDRLQIDTFWKACERSLQGVRND